MQAKAHWWVTCCTSSALSARKLCTSLSRTRARPAKDRSRTPGFWTRPKKKGNKTHLSRCLHLVFLMLSRISNAVVLRRLRIGHTRLTHSYLLNRQDQPDCSHCYCALTIAHVLLECNHYNAVRQRYFNVSSLHDLFDTVDAQNILGFIREIGLYRLL